METITKIKIKSILIPQHVDLLRKLGRMRIEQGNGYLELAKLIEHSSFEDALTLIRKSYTHLMSLK